MLRMHSFGSIRSLPWFALALFAASASADPTVSGGVSGNSGTGVPGHSVVTKDNLDVEAWGCLARAKGRGEVKGFEADLSQRATAQSYSVYKWIGYGEGGTWSWVANGVMEWAGHATVDTCIDADAKTSGSAMLDYSGDLTLRGAGAVAASSNGNGETEVTWTVSLTPTYQQKFKRSEHVLDDSVSSGSACDNQGNGNVVIVHVTAFAEGRLYLDTNAFGAGYADGDLYVRNYGKLTAAFTFTPDPARRTGGPSTGGPDGGGPSTGGPDGGGPTTPTDEIVPDPIPPSSEPKVIHVEVEMGDLPRVVDGEMGPLVVDLAAEPAPAAAPRTDVDADGNTWWPADESDPQWD